MAGRTMAELKKIDQTEKYGVSRLLIKEEPGEYKLTCYDPYVEQYRSTQRKGTGRWRNAYDAELGTVLKYSDQIEEQGDLDD